MDVSKIQERCRIVQDFIKRLMENDRQMSYDEAWYRAKNSAELSEVFAEMKNVKVDQSSPPQSPEVASKRAMVISELRRLEGTGLKYDEAWDYIKKDPIYFPELAESLKTGKPRQ